MMKLLFIPLILALVQLVYSFSAPTQMSFNPASVNLAAGQNVSISLVVFGLSSGDIASQAVVLHDTTHTPISNPQCSGIFAGADTLRATSPTVDWLGCVFADGVSVASGASGTFFTFTVTNVTGLPETLTLDTRYSYFMRPDFAAEFPAQLGNLVISSALTPTSTATITTTPTGTSVPSRTVTITPTGTLVPTNTPTPTGTSITLPPPNTATPTPCRPARRCETPGTEPPCWPPGHCRTRTPQISLPCFTPSWERCS